MNIQRFFKSVCLLGLTIAAIPAHASEILYDGTGFLVGQQSFMDTFSIDGPGTLTVTLTDQAWPVALASLNLEMSTPGGGLLGPEIGPGTATYALGQGGNVVAQWFGTAQGPMDAGTYGLEIQYTPLTPVPLPTTLLLLLSGLSLLAWQRRQTGRPLASQ